jgi:hypothetical protein
MGSRFRRVSNGLEDVWKTPVGWYATVDRYRGKRGEAEVIVGVDKTREQGAADQLHDRRLGTDARGNLSIGADGHDAPVVDSDGLCPSVTGIHSQDVAA